MKLFSKKKKKFKSVIFAVYVSEPNRRSYELDIYVISFIYCTIRRFECVIQ